MRNYLTLFFVFLFVVIYGQNDTIKKLNFSGYGELYYQYDFSNPTNHETSNFLYNHKRHNELNFNLLLVKANYLDKKYRANFGVMVGNYPQYNLKTEPIWAQFINEANIGVKLSNKINLWLDAGIMPSHIGFESIISADCWTLTRSILAENSPYYEAGLRLTYTSVDKKLYLSALVLNGWQKVTKPDYIQQPSFGMQANYKLNSKLILNYSNFIGTDKPDSINGLRHFHNFYFQLEPNSKLGLIAGFDLGFEKIMKSIYHNWYSPVIIARYKTSSKTIIAVRLEYYADPNGVIINEGNNKGFQTLGFSSNFDYQISDKLKWRIEGKMYKSKDKIFSNNSSRDNFYLTTNLTVSL